MMSRWGRYEHFHRLALFHPACPSQAISTLSPSNGLAMRAFRTRFHLLYIEANVCTWSNLFANIRHFPLLVTDLFANTRHYSRHWPFCEHSSSPSSYINRRLGLFFNADNTPCPHNKKHFHQLYSSSSMMQFSGSLLSILSVVSYFLDKFTSVSDPPIIRSLRVPFH